MTRKAGSIVINRLRDRIRLGRYFGRWRPGDRLPSVREVATQEDVDRKTAAAAYRLLQKEGLVRVEPRSGVYLQGGRAGEGRDPLRRLHLQWLEHALASAAELGLDAETVHRMFQGVAAVQKRRIPTVDPDADHAALLAREIQSWTGLECAAAQPHELPAQVGPLRDPPFVLATPAGEQALRALIRQVPVLTLTLNRGLFDEVCAAAREGAVLVVVGSRSLEEQLGQALDRGLVKRADRVTVRYPRSLADLETPGEGRSRILVWPGSPAWVGAALEDGSSSQTRLVDDTTLAEIRCQIARAALDHVSRSSASSTRRATAG